ncbi:iron-containing redox enzyme family protein [Janthinobacterium sp.]|uniref:TenA family transcriptional regulator n=1 Tax=Janthinobacterium sp. TaxID=1871054 RepID=UPI0025881B9A|nr:iron-containing redox enzyme family protein [Janthinobacterium sp.]MCX7293662.1 iron-containing redox enzyme family protein [Janthinobacterium sp.]
MNSLGYAIHATHDEQQLLGELWSDIFPHGLIKSLHEHPFLAACRSGAADHEMLCDFLIQHQYYSKYFTRYLCAMMASLPEQADVKALAENLMEEMGLDRPDVVTHGELYLNAMVAVGARPGSKPMHANTRQLIDAMFQHCRSSEPLEGLAALCLGAEAIVPVVYGAILAGLRSLDVAPEGLQFFEIHVADDEDHAIVMRKIIDRLIENQPQRREKVMAIGAEMVTLRMAMLSAIDMPQRQVA